MYTIANIRPLGHNIGNHAISFVLRHMIYETFGRLVSIIDYPATNRHESTAKAGLTPATVHEINRFADGVIVGGGNLFENDEIAVDSRALCSLQPPLMLFSNSRGRIYDRHGRLTDRSDVIPEAKLSALLARADISLSRDSATHSYASALNEKDELGWCPTINLGQYSDKLPVLPEDEEVGALIAIRTPGLMNVPFRHQSAVPEHIDGAIDALRDAGYRRIRVLCNDSRDMDFATVFRYTKRVDAVFTSDVYQYLALLKNASMVVSYRLHASLPAIAFGVPTVNVTYDERAMSLCEDLGIGPACINMVEADDEFPSRLRAEIINGAYGIDDHISVQPLWEQIRSSQFAHLQRFRKLMRSYMETGPSQRKRNKKS